MLYTVRLTPYDVKHKWKHYKNLINLLKRSKNAVIVRDFVWLVELEELLFDDVARMYINYIEPKDKMKVTLTTMEKCPLDEYLIKIYKRSIGELPT